MAEPLTGLVDTAFVARLGAAPLAALGAGATLLSSIFWIFNFLGIGTQTEVAQALGTGAREGARDTATLAMALALAIGAGLALLGWWLAEPAARFMSEDGGVQAGTVIYIKIRLLGGPAVLLTLAAFGTLRGLQDMRTPLKVALGANALNAGLDAVLIFGVGPIPAFGIAGAAWASTVGQWVGAGWAARAVQRRLGRAPRVPWRDAPALLRVGRDLFQRTGLLTLFLLLATRNATHMGVEAGAAHQAIRQIWIFTAFVLDAYAATAQSLGAYFLGAGRLRQARRVAGIACAWGLATGALLALLMLVSRDAVAALLVPDAARAIFGMPWVVAAVAQPINALSFVTDGIHWAARDYRFLRNVMLAATGSGVALLVAQPWLAPDSLVFVWIATAVWIGVRAGFGVARVWPGIGASPWRVAANAGERATE